MSEIIKDRWYRTHRGKRQHPTRAAAMKAVKRMHKKPGHKGRLVAYECPYCHQWHVGRVNK